MMVPKNIVENIVETIVKIVVSPAPADKGILLHAGRPGLGRNGEFCTKPDAAGLQRLLNTAGDTGSRAARRYPHL